MEIKCSVFIAASVDGFIARPDGENGFVQSRYQVTAEH